MLERPTLVEVFPATLADSESVADTTALLGLALGRALARQYHWSTVVVRLRHLVMTDSTFHRRYEVGAESEPGFVLAAPGVRPQYVAWPAERDSLAAALRAYARVAAAVAPTGAP